MVSTQKRRIRRSNWVNNHPLLQNGEGEKDSIWMQIKYNSMDKEFIKGQLKSALFWLNTSNTTKNILHAKDSINMAIKELEN